MNQIDVRAYWKDGKNKMDKLATTIDIDPEGITEEDVERLQKEVVIFMAAEQLVSKSPIFISIPGGKA